MSNGAYIMIKFDNREGLLPAVDKISESDKVSKWDAVDGHYNLVVKLKENDNDFVEMVHAFDGFSDISSCELTNDNEKVEPYSDDFSYSYLLIEAEPNHIDDVVKTLSSDEDITFCSKASGAYNLVCMIKGTTFDYIDKKLNNNIKDLDNVLRFKQERVIILDRM